VRGRFLVVAAPHDAQILVFLERLLTKTTSNSGMTAQNPLAFRNPWSIASRRFTHATVDPKISAFRALVSKLTTPAKRQVKRTIIPSFTSAPKLERPSNASG